MKLQMHENSLFAVLMRQPWWVSLLVAAGVAALLHLFLPIEFAIFGGLPFAVISMVVLWRELRRPSAKRVAQALERARALSSSEFCAALEEGYRRRGYGVQRGEGAADLMLTHKESAMLSGRQIQARALSDSGIEAVKIFLAQPRASRLEAGGVFNNAQVFQGIVVLPDDNPKLRGNFTFCRLPNEPSCRLRRFPKRFIAYSLGSTP